MAPVVVIQLVFLLLAVFQIETNSSTQNGFILLYCPDASSQKSTASCLVHGRPPIRRRDYTYTPGIGGHKIHTYGTRWNAARKICEREGGYLAIINSVAESELIAKLFKASLPHTGSSSPNFLHIGFHDLFEEGEYVTIHNEPFENAGFYEWYGDGPDNYQGTQNCGAVYIDGKLDDNACFATLGFVCEVPYVEKD